MDGPKEKTSGLRKCPDTFDRDPSEFFVRMPFTLPFGWTLTVEVHLSHRANYCAILKLQKA